MSKKRKKETVEINVVAEVVAKLREEFKPFEGNLKETYEAFLVDNVLKPFYDKRLTDLQELQLDEVLERKNPYLFKAKNILFPWDLVKSIVDAHLSSQEETIFGNLLETFAIYISSKLYNGYKPLAKKREKWCDLIFRRDNVIYLVEIKSGPKWSNSSSQRALIDTFLWVRNKLREAGIDEKFVNINGCMYGKEKKPFKKHETDSERDFFKYCGQDFWEFISKDPQLYQEIIVPLDKEAKQKNEQFKNAYNAKIYETTKDFMSRFMKENLIDWAGFLDFVSKREDGATLFAEPATEAAAPPSVTELINPEEEDAE